MHLLIYLRGQKVLQFIVLGQIPGTQTYVDLTLIINILGGIVIVCMLYVLFRRAIRRALDYKFKFIQLQLFSL